MMSISVQKLFKDKGISLPSLAEREKIAHALGTSSNEIAWGHSTPIEHFYGPV